MSSNLIPVKAYLGIYYPELLYSSTQDKYKNSGLDKFFEQRFFIQDNKSQMIIDPGLSGLTVVFTGNEIHISKDMYDHPNILVTNSIENTNQIGNPRSLYSSDTFSTLAYLVCNNHTTFQIVGGTDEPIYVKYRAEYETFYSSVAIFNIADDVEVEIIEELESFSALNCVTNYIIGSQARVSLTTFYMNHISAVSYTYRHVIAQEDSSYSHILFGKGSTSVIDENKIYAHSGSKSEIMGCVDCNSKKFNSILYVQPATTNYSINVDYRDIMYDTGLVSFFPVIISQDNTSNATISVSNITLDNIPDDEVDEKLAEYIKDIADRAVTERVTGVERFYHNKSKFLLFHK